MTHTFSSTKSRSAGCKIFTRCFTHHAIRTQTYPKAELEYRLKMALNKTEKELMANYPAEKALPVLDKLRDLVVGKVSPPPEKKPLPFVSPVVEKLFYLISR